MTVAIHVERGNSFGVIRTQTMNEESQLWNLPRRIPRSGLACTLYGVKPDAGSKRGQYESNFEFNILEQVDSPSVLRSRLLCLAERKKLQDIFRALLISSQFHSIWIPLHYSATIEAEIAK